MKTIADFKRAMVLGTLVHCTFHCARKGRDPETGQVIYGDEDKGIRPVSIVQSNSFALKTTKTDGTIVDSWCQWPKRDDVQFLNDGSVVIFEHDRDRGRIPVLTYKIQTN